MSSDDIARDAISQAERLGRDGDAYLADSAQPATPSWATESTVALPITDTFPDEDE